jgi:hypothetical protein
MQVINYALREPAKEVLSAHEAKDSERQTNN